MDSLPPEIMLHIFSFVDSRQLALIARTCKLWHVFANDNSLWRQRIADFIQGPPAQLSVDTCKKLLFMLSKFRIVSEPANPKRCYGRRIYNPSENVVIDFPMRRNTGVFSWVIKLETTRSSQKPTYEAEPYANIGVVDLPTTSEALQGSVHGWAFFTLTKYHFRQSKYLPPTEETKLATPLHPHEVQTTLDTNQGTLSFAMGDKYYGVAYSNLFDHSNRIFWPALTPTNLQLVEVTAFEINGQLIRLNNNEPAEAISLYADA